MKLYVPNHEGEAARLVVRAVFDFAAEALPLLRPAIDAARHVVLGPLWEEFAARLIEKELAAKW